MGAHWLTRDSWSRTHKRLRYSSLFPYDDESSRHGFAMTAFRNLSKLNAPLLPPLQLFQLPKMSIVPTLVTVGLAIASRPLGFGREAWPCRVARTCMRLGRGVVERLWTRHSARTSPPTSV